MIRAALVMDPQLVPFVLPDSTMSRLRAVSQLTGPVRDIGELSDANRRALEVLITGWGVNPLSRERLDQLPGLRAVIHWGGGVDFLDPSAWHRGVAVSSAGWANAIPVAEFTVAMITLAAKDALWIARKYASEQRAIDREVEVPFSGLYGTSVGIVGASRVGARVLEMLRNYDVVTTLFDPYCTPERASQLGAQWLPSLIEVARSSRILSVHAPAIPSTRGMISRAVLAELPDGATIINTSRGSLIDQDALLDELVQGRLRAVLDVTEPEVLPEGHALYSLPNVFLTPHLAGSTGNELFRLGLAVAEELERFARGEPLAHTVQRGAV